MLIPLVLLAACGGPETKPVGPGSKTISAKRGDATNKQSPGRAFTEKLNEGRALLVGCTVYDNLPKSRQLVAPANDVALMRKLLVEKFRFPEEQITTLAEGLSTPALRPTRSNIQREFQRLAEKADPGDRVVIHLAGHGTWQPDDDPDNPHDLEPDGRDEVFCPADVSRLGAGKIGNGITDDDLRRWLQAIVDRGAFVWIIADACHSGTLARSDDNIPRGFHPAELRAQERPRTGTDDGAGAGESRGTSDETAESPSGNFVALYAAQPFEETVEARFPKDDAQGTRFGLLTYTLCQVLNQCESPITYWELVQRIHARYVHQDRYSPTPFLEGEQVDREVLGRKTLPGRSRVTLSRSKGGTYKLNAGALHDLTRGSVLVVYPPAGSANGGRRLGHVRVTQVRALDSTAAPCEYGGVPLQRDFAEGCRCEIAFHDFELRRLRLGIDRLDEARNPIPSERLESLRQRVMALAKTDSPLVSLANDPGQADWLLRIGKGLLFLVRAAADPGDTTAKASGFGPVPEERLADWLRVRTRRIARATNLVRLAAAPQGQNRAGKLVDVDIQMLRCADPSDTKGRPIRWQREGLILKAGDLIAFRVSNRSRVTVDVCLLFVDSGYGISQFFPEPGTGGNRLKPGSSFTTTPGRVDAATIGIEHLVSIAVKANPQTAPLEFTFLQQPRCEQSTRSDEESVLPQGAAWNFPLAQFLIHAKTDVTKSRGFSHGRLQEHALRLFTWKTLAD